MWYEMIKGISWDILFINLNRYICILCKADEPKNGMLRLDNGALGLKYPSLRKQKVGPQLLNPSRG